MKISGEYEFEASQDQVWEALQDPGVLTQVLPGCEKLDLVGENQYEGALKIKVGPVQGKFQGKIQLTDIDEPNGYTMNVDGRGAPGFVKATAAVKLEGADAGTRMSYDADAQVGGRIASVGQRLLDSSAKAIIKQSLEGLNELMKARLAATGGGAAEAAAAEGEPAAADGASDEAPAPEQGPPAYTPPSEAEFAANVAKEVAKDLIPPWVWIVGGVALLLLVLYLLM